MKRARPTAAFGDFKLMDMTVEALTPDGAKEWNSLLERCPGATFYHSMEFQEHYRHKCETIAYLLFRRGSKIVAGLAGGICISGDTKILRSPFSASFAGFVFPSNIGGRTCLELLETLRDWCSRRGVSAVELGQTPDIYGAGRGDVIEYAMLASGYSMTAFELCHYLTLLEKPESLFTSSARAQYRQGLDSGLEIGPSRDLSASYDLIETNKRMKGTVPSVPREDYLALAGLFEGRVRTYSVFLENREIAVGVFYALSRTGLMTFWLAHEEDALKHRPINYLVWEVARQSFREGYRTLDLGTTSDGGVLNHGLSHFKEGIGGRPFLRRRFRRDLG